VRSATFALEASTVCIDESDEVILLEAALCCDVSQVNDLTDSFVTNGDGLARPPVPRSYLPLSTAWPPG